MELTESERKLIITTLNSVSIQGNLQQVKDLTVQIDALLEKLAKETATNEKE